MFLFIFSVVSFFFQNTEQGTSDSEAEDEKLEELETMLKEHDPEFQK